MKYFEKVFLFLLLFLCALPSDAQQKAKFSIVRFELDLFDTTAQNEKESDNDGNPYAIIKVSSENPNDNLSEYQFDFGNLNCKAKKHENELWLYVQKNAKFVTISRKNYETIKRHSLGTTLEEGKTYKLVLNSQGTIIHKQMVVIEVYPKDAKGVAAIFRREGEQEDILGVAQNGVVVRHLPLGNYEFKITSDNYKESSPTRFTLSNNERYYEKVKLEPNFATVTLQTNSEAQIYVDGLKKGVRTWTGVLNAGSHYIECKQDKHKTSIQNIVVIENQDSTYQITPPTPLYGTLSVISTPLNAEIFIDGHKRGVSPLYIKELLIGKHELTLKKKKYETIEKNFEILEKQTTAIDITLGIADKKNSCFYLDAGGAIGTSMEVGANAGVFLKDFNAEVFYNMGLSSETFYINSNEEPKSEDVSFQRFGGKIGYGFYLGSHFRITPQVGLACYSISGDNLKSNAMSILFGAKCEYFFNSHWGLTASPEGMFAMKKGDIYKEMAELSSKAKGWTTGVNIHVGIEFRF